MNACDRTVLEFLVGLAGFSDSQIHYLSQWWQACRDADEELARFLQRQRLLSDATVQIFRQVGQQNLSLALGRMLIDRSELETLRRRLPEVAVLESAGM